MPEQAESLRALGCDLGQGFLFARPLDAEDSLAASWPSGRARPPMHHSYEGLDRAGRRVAAGAARAAAAARLPAAVDGHVRLAAGRRRVHRRPRLAGLPAERRADGDGHGRRGDDRADDRLPARRRRAERPARPPAPDARRGRRAAARRRRARRPQPSRGALEIWHVGAARRRLRHGPGVLRPGVRRDRPRPRARRPARAGQRAGPADPADRAAHGRAGARRRARGRLRRRRGVRARRGELRPLRARAAAHAPARARPRAGRAGRLVLGDLRDGWRFVRRAPLALGHVRQRGDRLPALHGPGRGARPVRRQARPRRRRRATSASSSAPAGSRRS